MSPSVWVPNAAKTIIKQTTTPATPGKSNSTRREALSLYREVLRTAKAFHWVDERDGVPWNLKLKQQARKEFEQSKQEKDPLILARMLVVGRDCVQQIQNKFNEADRKAWERIEKDSSRRR